MRKLVLFVVCSLLIFPFSACATHSPAQSGTASSVDDTQSGTDEERYIIQTTFYQIYEEGLQRYRYRITSGKDTLVEEIKTGTAPRIEDKGGGILKLHLGFGTNAFSVKYFDVYDKRVSAEFHPYSVYADYVDTATDDYYFAFFKPEEKPKLYISGFFDSSAFYNVLDLHFSMATCEKLLFLNNTQLYIEYIDRDSNTVKKIVDFKTETSIVR